MELEVARRLEEREKQRREEEEAAAQAAAAASTSRSLSADSSLHQSESSIDSTPALQTLPSGLLTPLLKSSQTRESHEDELKRRLDELEARLCELFLNFAGRVSD